MKKVTVLVLALILVLVSLVACSGKKDDETGGKVTDFYISSPDDTGDNTKDSQPTTSSVSFACVGDNIIYQCAFTDAASRADAEYPDYNFTPVYSDVLPALQAADFAYVNQETLMAGAEYGYSDYPCFNSPQTLGDQLCNMGFDIISIANNHMLDMGSAGIEDTINFWNTKNVTMIGGYLNEEDYQIPRIIEKNGVSIALLAYTYATNGISLSSSSSVIIPYIDDQTITEDVARAKAAADCVVVSIHWGVENSFTPSDEQTHVAQLMCDAGVDVIIGSHPHVIQPIEWLTSSNGDNETLCIYSLGDFVAVMMKSYNMLGGIATFDIVKIRDDIKVEKVLFTPTVHYFGPSYYNSHVYYLSDFTSELASSFGNVYGITDGYDELCSYVKNTISAQFLPDYLK